MSARRFAWGLAIAAGACMAAGLALGGGMDRAPSATSIFAVVLVVFGVVGALVAAGRP